MLWMAVLGTAIMWFSIPSIHSSRRGGKQTEYQFFLNSMTKSFKISEFNQISATFSYILPFMNQKTRILNKL